MTDQPPEYSLRDGQWLDINPRPDLLRRSPATVDPTQGLSELHQKLAIATVIYEKHGDAGQVGAAQALRDVIDYLRGQGLPAPALLPLFDLTTGLDQLKDRIVPALLTPAKGPGHPPKTRKAVATDAFLAVVMECCVRHYRDNERCRDHLTPAGRLAAKLINQSSLGIRVTGNTMKKLREAVTTEMSTGRRRSLFEDFMAEAAAAPSILEWVKNFIATGWVPSPKVSQ